MSSSAVSRASSSGTPAAAEEVLADQATEEVVGSFHRFLTEAIVLAFDEQNGIERVSDGVLEVDGVDICFVHVKRI
ncbi:hypothetical protein E0500_029745 [Streptomyces sp. KM273126]|uniref:hypothetical protein n=1 Tax=Streptomyces sp. KM273126 TaxID=2545247 RepID=UPI00103A6891|nr:hypothetical protein [Streptomyces sp. KM273126]MBA2811423.1 hypothetical protein [Streptomyces sp. KM273126]